MRERSFQLSPKKTQFIKDERGLQADIARRLEIKPARLVHYLSGSRHIPEHLLMQLCKAVSKKPSDFLDSSAEKILADQSFSA